MLVILDLDYTLLDTKRFKADLATVYGLGEEEFNLSSKEIFKDKKLNYDPMVHLKILGKDNNETKEKLHNFLKKIDIYVFPGAQKLLEALQNKKAEIILLSYGNENWQKMKIENLGLKKYFDKVIYTSKNKEKALKIFQQKKDAVIINDNAKEIFAMREVLGQSRFYIVNGPYANNVEHNAPVYGLEELINKFSSYE